MPATRARWNPFSFPSDVDFAFGLLVAVILGTSLLIYLAIANTVASGFERASLRDVRCQARAGPLEPADSLDYRQHWLQTFMACQGEKRAPPVWVLAGVGTLVIGTVTVYLLTPSLKIRKGRFVPLPEADAAEVIEELRGLCRIAGTSIRPAFVWNPLDTSCSGIAFGRPGRRFVGISGGLVTKRWTDPDVFRAVVLHELAHLRNRDVDKAYWMMAVWWSFLGTALLPFALSAFPGDADVIVRRGLSIAALATVVYLLRNAALRARETYADVRASTWPPVVGGLDRALPPETVRAGGWTASLAVRIRDWWSPHPSPAARRRAVRDTSPLFTAGVWFAVGTGLAASLALVGVQAVVDALVPGAGDWSGALLFAGLVVGVTGVAVWRATFLALARGEPVRGVWRVAVALAGGVALGDVLSLSTTATRPAAFALTGAALLIFDAMWYGLLVVGCGLFLRWVVACASVWLPVVAARPSPVRALLIAVPPSILVLGVGLEFLFYISSVRAIGGLLPASVIAPALSGITGTHIPAGPYFETALAAGYLIVRVSTSPFFYLAVQILWVVPLAAWLSRRRAAPVETATWALLEPASIAPRAPTSGSLRPGLSVATGLGGGVLFGIVTIPLSLDLRAASPDALVTWLGDGQPVLGVLLQTVVAVVLALRVRRLGVLHGLLGAFVCGGVAAFLALCAAALTLGPGALFVTAFVPSTLTTSLNVGTLIALPLASAAAGLAAVIRQPGAPPQFSPDGRWWWDGRRWLAAGDAPTETSSR